MLLDARTLSTGGTLHADVCVVGAGAAGITLARELASHSVAVCLLESGGLEAEPQTQALARAENVGLPYFPLDENRVRAFGGTTHKWAGWCRLLDAIDFQRRAWVPQSGWPIRREDLFPYYRRAHELCQLETCEYDVGFWEQRLNVRRLPLPADQVVTRIYLLSPPTRFGEAYRNDLAQAAQVTVALHATVLEIETDASARTVTRLRAACLTGQRFSVVARWYVLAAGALENARLLLVSSQVSPAGLGNEHDLVGRYFMEHVHFPAGVLFGTAEAPRVTDLYCRLNQRVTARLFLPEAVQQREQLLNSNVMLERLDPNTAPAEPLPAAYGTVRSGQPMFRLHHTLEQAPNSGSRLTLGIGRDALGLPRTRLDWRLADLERRTFVRCTELVGRAFAQAGLGRLHLAAGDNHEEWPPQPLQGLRGHHMGTTRMSTDPRQGVVDEQCKVHGITNLFVAGSSVFPTSGAGTPTITLVALALRLADHVRSLLGQPVPVVAAAAESAPLPQTEGLPAQPAGEVTTFTLVPPERKGQEILFRWSVVPATPLYYRTQFTMRFPDSIDVSLLPGRLWWSIALICLHSHWTLLRPCRIRLPIRLDPTEREFWYRLLDTELALLAARRGSPIGERAIEILDDGPVLEPWSRLPDSDRCAMAFSGGKDSLVQVGLLTEMGLRPVLVATTAPMPPAVSHQTTRRRQVFDQIVRRRNVTLVEVESDFRSCWDNGFGYRQNYPWMVQEMTDPFLYFSALLAVSVALGTPHLFVAGEAEVQEADRYASRIILLNRFTYCAVMQHALQCWLAPLGIRYSSAVTPLSSFQIQKLLWDRYPDLADLQYSCFLMEADAPACNQCRRCFRVSVDVLACGHSPALLGIDPVEVFRSLRWWHPKRDYAGADPAFEARWGAHHFDLQVVRNIQGLSLGAVWKALAAGNPKAFEGPEGWDALVAFSDMRRRLANYPAGEHGGYRAGFGRWIDPLLRARVLDVCAAHFPAMPAEDYAEVQALNDELARWIAEPLGGGPTDR